MENDQQENPPALNLPPKGLKHPITGCAAWTLFGAWFIQQEALTALVEHALTYDLLELRKVQANPISSEDPPAYEDHNGVAVIRIAGPLTKHPTSFANVMENSSYAGIRQNLKKAENDPLIKAILLHFDGCPGGTVAGAYETAAAINRTRAKKPVFTHIDDSGYSAAYLLASQCQEISIDPAGWTGSIGTLSALTDSSKRYDQAGMKVIPIASGKYKGVGMPGTTPTPEQIEYIQGNINTLNAMFLEHVKKGRKLDDKSIEEVSDAKVYSAPQALSLKLVDRICDIEDSIESLRRFMPFSEQQVLRIKAISGAENLKNEELESGLLELAEKMSKQMTGMVPKPREVDPDVAKGRLEIAHEKIDLMVDRGFLAPPQAKHLKDNLKLSWLEGEQPAFKVISEVITMNTPRPLLGEKTKAQPAPRVEPGANDPAHVDAAENFNNRKFNGTKKE